MKAHEARQLSTKTEAGQYGEIMVKVKEAAAKGERKIQFDKVDPAVRERLIADGYTFNLVGVSKGESTEISW